MLTLYRAPGVRADQELFLCFVALREKRLDFELKEAGPEDARRALGGRLPAVAHGEHWISEGIAVAEYLAETFPFPNNPRLFPGDLPRRARCRQLMLWPRVALPALFAERPVELVLSPRAAPPLSPAARAEAERLVQVAEQVLPEAGGTLFPDWCVADADFAFTLRRLLNAGDALPPRVRAYAEARWERPSVREFLEGPGRAP